MKQGDLIVLAFPYANLTQSKWRPAVVLSNERYNLHANILLAGIYSKEQPFSVSIDNKDIVHGELRKQSYVGLQNIFSADKSILRGPAGALNTRKMKEILAAVKKCL